MIFNTMADEKGDSEGASIATFSLERKVDLKRGSNGACTFTQTCTSVTGFLC